ncbi:MAG TPA: ABC transporter permease [Bryobacteraceae bacterium]|nr:ABC transporter permease [Bryobacteraceae bacterium]
MNRLFDQGLSRLSQVPGVESAALALSVPFARPLNTPVWLPASPKDQPQITNLTYMSSSYFGALRIPLRRGRYLSEADTAHSAKVVVVNDAFVERYLPRQDPLGVLLNFGGGEALQVVGVIGNVRQRPGFGNYGPLGAPPGAYTRSGRPRSRRCTWSIRGSHRAGSSGATARRRKCKGLSKR